MLESVWFQLASWTIFYHETSFRFREFWIGNMQIPTLNKYIKSNQNKFIVETNALKEILIYLLFVIVIVVIITTATTIVPLLIGKKPHIFVIWKNKPEIFVIDELFHCVAVLIGFNLFSYCFYQFCFFLSTNQIKTSQKGKYGKVIFQAWCKNLHFIFKKSRRQKLQSWLVTYFK